jgi:hypothetical protein
MSANAQEAGIQRASGWASFQIVPQSNVCSEPRLSFDSSASFGFSTRAAPPANFKLIKCYYSSVTFASKNSHLRLDPTG